MSWMHASPLFFLNKYNQVNIAESFSVPKDLAVSQGHHSEQRYSLPRTGEVERRSSWPNVCWPWSSPKKLSLLLNLWYHLLFFCFLIICFFPKSSGQKFCLFEDSDPSDFTINRYLKVILESEIRADTRYTFIGFSLGSALKLRPLGLWEILPTEEVPGASQNAPGAWKLEVGVEWSRLWGWRAMALLQRAALNQDGPCLKSAMQSIEHSQLQGKRWTF